MYLHGEGYGNPLQYSYLENPVDGGAWWAAIYGVAQNRACIFKFSFSLVQLFLNWENKNISSLSILLFICAPLPFPLYLALTGLVMAHVLHRKQAMIQVSSLTCSSLSHPC